MRSAIRLLFLICVVHHLRGAALTFQIASESPGAWAEALSSLGLTELKEGNADVIVAASGDYRARVERGAIVIIEGDSVAAASFGIRASEKKAIVRSVVDVRAPKLGIVWEDKVTITRFELPAKAQVFAREKWEGAPLMARHPRV
jgi:hypothetical protein